MTSLRTKTKEMKLIFKLVSFPKENKQLKCQLSIVSFLFWNLEVIFYFLFFGLGSLFGTKESQDLIMENSRMKSA